MHRGILFVLALAGMATAASAQKAVTAYRMDTVAGTTGMGDGGSAAAAQIGSIQGIAVDRLGNLYLSDTDNHRVRKVSAVNGVISLFAGTGTPGFSGDGAAATAAQLNLPYGLSTDVAGNVYVADLGNNRVRRIGPDGIIQTVAGTGLMGSAGDGGLATSAQLMAPRNVAIDAAGNLYIAEFEGHRIRRVSTDGKISTVAGTGVAGFRGDGGAATAAQLGYPAGLALGRDGSLYIVDSQNQRVRKVTSGVITTVLGGTAATALLTPTAVAVDAAGTVYVGDRSHIVRAYTASGVWANFAGNGGQTFAGDSGPAASAQLTSIGGLAAAPSGNLFIADGVRVREVTNGVIQTVAGDGYLRAVGDGGSATSAQLFHPSAVALDAAGNLYIADAGTERIRRVTATGQITTVAGDGVAGYGGDGALAVKAELNAPSGVMVDVFGDIVIADSGNHRVRQFGSGNLIQTVAGTGAADLGPEGLPPTETALNGARGVCGDRSGALYIVDTGNHRVLRAAPGAGVATAAGNGSAGNGGDGGVARLAQLNQPAACALDSAGDLFIADTGNHSIRKVTPAGAISTVTGTGAAGLAGDSGAATAALLNAPQGVAVDGDGQIFIADTGNQLIRLVTTDGVMHTIAGTDPAAPLRSPTGLALDGSGDLYFAEAGANLVRRLTPAVAAAAGNLTDTSPAAPLTVVSSASLAAGPVAPGEVLTLFGSGLGPESGVVGTFDSTGLLSTLVAGTEVRFDGVPAPVFYAQAGQINAQAPYSIAGAASTRIEVLVKGQSVASLTEPVAAASPALFPVVANQDGSPDSGSAPAAPNSIITLFATGEGLTDGSNISGQTATAPYAHPRQPVILTIAGVAAELLYAGSAPGMVGMLQINARVPGGFVAPGPAAVILTIGGVSSAPITIWID